MKTPAHKLLQGEALLASPGYWIPRRILVLVGAVVLLIGAAFVEAGLPTLGSTAMVLGAVIFIANS